MKNYSDYNIEIPYSRHSGNVKTFCPECHHNRNDKRDKSLSVNLDKGVWKCHYCGWTGSLHIGERRINTYKREYRKPAPRPTTSLSPITIEWFGKRGISVQTLSRLKVTDGKHFMPQSGSQDDTIQFNYYLKDVLINVKYRTYDKKFAMETGAELIPYNLDSITGKTECIITEGEMDCLSFIEIGKSNCISVPNGAGSNLSYLDDFIDGWFEDKEIIYVAVDTDEKGIILRDELVRRFGAERCRIVTFGDDCKDANEHLVKYGKTSLLSCLDNAQEIRTEGIFTLSEFEENVDDMYYNGLPKGATIGHENFDRLCSFETKRLVVVTGIPGSGKSEFVDEIAERLCILHGWRFGIFSPENAPMSYHTGKLIEKYAGVKCSREYMTESLFKKSKTFVNSNFFFIDPNDDYDIETILEKARYLVRRHGIKGLIIDPFNRLDLNFSKNKETDVIRDILRKIIFFAQQNDVLVFLVAHPTKLQPDKDGIVKAPNLYDIAGSAHFFNMADYGITVHRNRTANNVEIYIRKVRFKHMGTVGKITMLYNFTNGRYIQEVPGQNPKWNNECHDCLITSSDLNSEVFTEQSIPNIDTLTEDYLFSKPLIPQLYD